MTAGRRVLAWAVPALALAAAGCGGSSDDRFDLRTPRAKATATPRAGDSGAAAQRLTRRLNREEPVTRAEERVIRRWASTLRHGHVARAARYFALPSVVSNGFAPVKITKRREAEAFNLGLTCGAEVVRLDRQVHHYVLTTFRLVNRPGPGHEPCGGGGTARTAFLIRHGHIAQWVRVPDPSQGGAAGSQSSAS